MAMKDFNWKQFLVQKGERVALGVAGLIALLLLAVNVKSFLSAGPGKHAKALEAKTNNLNQQLASNTPKKDEDKPGPVDSAKFKDNTITDPSEYQVASLFSTSDSSDKTRRQPDLLLPVEGKVAFVNAQLSTYMFDKDKNDNLLIKIKIIKDAGGNTPANQANQGVGRGFGGRRGGNAVRALQNTNNTNTSDLVDLGSILKGEFIPVDKLADRTDVALLQTIRPQRMAIIAASFPLKAQIDEFCKKLKKKPDEILDEASEEALETEDAMGKLQKVILPSFRFLNVVVERRQVDHQGHPVYPDAGPYKNGYEPLDVVGEYKPLLVLSGLQTEEEDKELDPVYQDGLVMPRLFSARPEQYPKVEKELPTIQKTLKAMKEADTSRIGRVTNPFDPNGIDPFNQRPAGAGNNPNPAAPPGPNGPNPLGGRLTGRLPIGPAQPGAVNPQQGSLILPEYCLIRVIDVTIKAGESYQYRLRVRMANPNWGRSDAANPQDAEKTENNKELKWNSNPDKQWFEIKDTVTVPSELHYYAVDQKAIDGANYFGANGAAKVGRDQVVLQIHKFLDNAASPGSRKNVPVGEWSVAERVIVSRGEIIDRPVRVQVPLFVEEIGEWRLGSTPSTGEKGQSREPGIDVPFGGTGQPAILVDFDGGDRLKYKHGTDEVNDAAGLEVMILRPDGRLLVHSGIVDAKDTERTKMYSAWKTRITDLQKKMNGDPMNPMNPGGPAGPRDPFNRGGNGGRPGGWRNNLPFTFRAIGAERKRTDIEFAWGRPSGRPSRLPSRNSARQPFDFVRRRW